MCAEFRVACRAPYLVAHFELDVRIFRYAAGLATPESLLLFNGHECAEIDEPFEEPEAEADDDESDDGWEYKFSLREHIGELRDEGAPLSFIRLMPDQRLCLATYNSVAISEPRPSAPVHVFDGRQIDWHISAVLVLSSGIVVTAHETERYL